MKSDYEMVVLVMIGVTVVAVTAIIMKYIWRKRGPSRLLRDQYVAHTVHLMDKQELSHDTRKFRFALPSPNDVLGLPVGHYIFVSAEINGETIFRPYTPVSGDDNFGFLDLVVKVYFRDVHPSFPEGGIMSQYLESLSIGDSIAIWGPIGALTYLGNGNFAIRKKKEFCQIGEKKYETKIHSVKNVGMIAGGTGITPMLQLIREVIKVPSDFLKIYVLFANQTEEDILLRSELDAIAVKHGNRFKIWYTIEDVSENWKYSEGFINDRMIERHLPPPSDDTLILMCGPPPMIERACIPELDKLGYCSNLRFEY